MGCSGVTGHHHDEVRAELLVPPGENPMDWYMEAAALARDHGAVLRGHLDTWDALFALMCEGVVQIGVVPSRSMLDPARLPRIVAIDEQPRGPRLISPEPRPVWQPRRWRR